MPSSDLPDVDRIIARMTRDDAYALMMWIAAAVIITGIIIVVIKR